MRRLGTAVSVLFLLSLGSVAAAQDLASSPGAPCTDEAANSAHPVWKAIEAQYARLSEAIRKKDFEAMVTLYAPDFRVVMPNGEVWSREQSLDYQRKAFEVVVETFHVSNTIVRLTLCGDSARAVVLQQWYRKQMKGNRVRFVETNAVQTEEWVRRGDVWKRRNIDDIHAGAGFVDGKRVDFSKPYDPEAPLYDPDEPHPRQPVADALFSIIAAKGTATLSESYEKLLDSYAYYSSEYQLNSVGYRLLTAKKILEAIDVFRFTAGKYPRSANAYDSLAEAYAAAGEKKLAIKNYEKSLTLNPQNTNARQALAKLRAHAAT